MFLYAYYLEDAEVHGEIVHRQAQRRFGQVEAFYLQTIIVYVPLLDCVVHWLVSVVDCVCCLPAIE